MIISFVIPALNEEDHIAGCVRSIQREIQSSCFDPALFEIIVVDNGCTDATAPRALEVGARVIIEPRRGLLFARQAGYLASRGVYVANIDADCRLRPGWIRYALLLIHNAVVVSGPYRYSDLPFYGQLVCDVCFAFYALANKLGVCNLMGGNNIVRRSVLDKIGGYDTSLTFWGEDTWFVLECAKHGRVKFDYWLAVGSSGRRLLRDGYIRTFLRYMANHFSMRLRGRPYIPKSERTA